MVVCIQYLYIHADSFLPHVIKRSLLYLGPQTVHVLSVFYEKLWSADSEAGISLGYTSIHSLCLPWFTIAVYMQYLYTDSFLPCRMS